MITGLKYTNTKGQVFDFDQKGVHPVFTGAYDWEASVLELNGTVAEFSRSSNEIEIGCAITRWARRNKVMDELYEVIAYDLAANAEGTLSIGEWQMTGAFTKSAKTNWWRQSEGVSYTLTFRAQNPYWVRINAQSFYRVTAPGSALDYPHDYPFDYGGSGQSGSIIADTVYDCDFRMIIYGAATNPYVIIGNTRYQINTALASGDILIIDTAKCIVEKRTEAGIVSNEFSNTPDASRGSGEYIFELIKPGASYMSWDGTFGFDLTIYERRDERAWS